MFSLFRKKSENIFYPEIQKLDKIQKVSIINFLLELSHREGVIQKDNEFNFVSNFASKLNLRCSDCSKYLNNNDIMLSPLKNPAFENMFQTLSNLSIFIKHILVDEVYQLIKIQSKPNQRGNQFVLDMFAEIGIDEDDFGIVAFYKQTKKNGGYFYKDKDLNKLAHEINLDFGQMTVLNQLGGRRFQSKIFASPSEYIRNLFTINNPKLKIISENVGNKDKTYIEFLFLISLCMHSLINTRSHFESINSDLGKIDNVKSTEETIYLLSLLDSFEIHPELVSQFSDLRKKIRRLN